MIFSKVVIEKSVKKNVDTSKKRWARIWASGQIQQFESESSYYFLKSFANIFPISYCFMDWLAVSLRPKISHSNLVNPLISEYCSCYHFYNYEEFIREQSYFIITFRVQVLLFHTYQLRSSIAINMILKLNWKL